jgi:hypothetical protein
MAKSEPREDSIFARYRNVLRYYLERGARDCIQASLEAGEVNPFEFDCEMETETKYAAKKTIQTLLSGSRDMLLRIQREVLEEGALSPLQSEVQEQLTTYHSLNPIESKAFEHAICAIGQYFPPSRICLFDGYQTDGYDEKKEEFAYRRRDMAVIWEGFEGVAWPRRGIAIRRVFSHPRFTFIGVTPAEIETNAIPRISSRLRGAKTIDATRVSDLIARIAIDHRRQMGHTDFPTTPLNNGET